MDLPILDDNVSRDMLETACSGHRCHKRARAADSFAQHMAPPSWPTGAAARREDRLGSVDHTAELDRDHSVRTDAPPQQSDSADAIADAAPPADADGPETEAGAAVSGRPS